MFRFLLLLSCCTLSSVLTGLSANIHSLSAPQVGANELKIISPTILELSMVTTKSENSSQVTVWNFVSESGQPALPKPNRFKVTINGTSVPVLAVGFKRRVLYAPLRTRD